jgi:hypothetical protein
MDSTQDTEPTFRANKRRKVFRKRTDADDDGEQPTTAPATAHEDADVGDSGVAVPVVKRPAVKKHGIAFSSTSGPQRAQTEQEDAGSPVPVVHPSGDQNVIQTDRFVKPTGKAATTVDDKHLYEVPSPMML